MSSAKSDSFTSSFPIWRPLIFFLVWLLWLGLPILCWIAVVRVDILIFFLNLAGKAFNFSLLGIIWVCHNWLLLCWDIFPLYPAWRDFLSWMDVEFCQMLFCVYWDYHVICFYSSFVNVDYIDWFANTEPSLGFWSSIWSWCMILCVCVCVCVCVYSFLLQLLNISVSEVTLLPKGNNNSMSLVLDTSGFELWPYFLELEWELYYTFNNNKNTVHKNETKKVSASNWHQTVDSPK